MVCSNCGKQVENGKKFCPYCGAAAGGTESEKKKSLPKWLFFAGGAVLVLAVCAALLLGGLFGGDRGELRKAALNSLAAWKDAAEALDLPDLGALTGSGKFSQEFLAGDLELGGDLRQELPGGISSEGFGLRGSARTDLPGRRLSGSLALTYGSADLVELKLSAEESLLAVSSPELTGERAFGLDTAALGRTLVEMGLADEEMSGVGFNLFDVAGQFTALRGQRENAAEKLKAAALELCAAMKVKKAGKETLDVNGHDLECAVYNATLPADAVKTFLEKAEDAYEGAGLQDAAEAFLGSLGLPEGWRKEREAFYGEWEENLRELARMIEEQGDLELRAAVSGETVAALALTLEDETGGHELRLSLGGGERYVDDLSLALVDGGGEFARLSFSGDHVAKSGVFTDTAKLFYGGRELFISELRLGAGRGDREVSWHVLKGERGLIAEGTLRPGEDALTLELDTLALSAYDLEKTARLSLTYTLGAYKAPEPLGEPTMIAGIDEAELAQIQKELTLNLSRWAIGLIGRIPGLQEYVYGLIFGA